MKKISTYLALLSVAANVCVVLLVGHTSRFMGKVYEQLLEGAPLPALTQRVLASSWWPWLFVALGLGAAATSVFTPVKSGTVSHWLTGILSLEVLALGLTTLGLCLPLYMPIYTLSP